MSEAEIGVKPKKLNWCRNCKLTLHVEKEDAYCRYCGLGLASEEEALCECGRSLYFRDSFCPRCARKAKEQP